MSKNDGGSAFPQIKRPVEWDSKGNVVTVERWTYGGMSLRDYASIKVLQSLIIAYKAENPGKQPLASTIIKECFMFADSWLEERDK